MSSVNPQEKIIRSFDRRSGYFSEESTWSGNSSLNRYICRILLRYIKKLARPVVVLDYGAGTGQVGRLLSREEIIVDVADISEEMLKKCEFARRRINTSQDPLVELYDGILLRQVLQYIEKEKWISFLGDLFSHLQVNRPLVFSQIVPYCLIDYDFWHTLVRIRRPDRQSFPTENDFIKLCEELGYRIVHFSRSYTRQSLKDWIAHEGAELREEVVSFLTRRTSTVNTLWQFRQHKNGDLSWRNNWVHIVVQK
jgi:SAM-dependent methyltransferase